MVEIFLERKEEREMEEGKEEREREENWEKGGEWEEKKRRLSTVESGPGGMAGGSEGRGSKVRSGGTRVRVR